MRPGCPRLEERLDTRLHRLLLDLRGALSRALSQSSDASRAVREIRSEGWTLYLVVDQQQEDGGGAALELTGKRPASQPPVFRIDGSDLTFLRSIGIDPTRSLRRRRLPGPDRPPGSGDSVS